MSAIAVDPRPDRTWRPLVAVTSIAMAVAVWALTGFSPYMAPFVVVAIVGAAAVALLVPARPVAAVGIVFLLAVFERFEVETTLGTMRLEQPAIAALLVATVWHRRRLDLPSIRAIRILLASAAVYLGSLTASSLLVAEEPLLSLRIVLWSAISMVGGLLAALLLYRRIRPFLPWLAATGAVLALIGIATAISFVLFGNWLSLVGRIDNPRVFLPAYEPNLYASLVAFLAPIGIELFRERQTLRNALLAALPLLGLGLAMTRAAYIGLAVGLVAYLLLHLRLEGITSALRRATATTLIAAVIGLALPSVLLNSSFFGLLEPAVADVVDPQRTPNPAPTPTPTAEPDDPAELVDLDTFDYRIERVQIGLHEWKESPIIGRGAYSYGQRHISDQDIPEVIAVLPVLVLHDAGIVGFVALGTFLSVLALLLWRATSDRRRAPPAIALGSALLIMLVGYLSTVALHFAVTWIVIGAAVAAAWPDRDPGPSGRAETST